MTIGGVLAILFTLSWIAVFFCRTEELNQSLPVLSTSERVSSFLSIVTLSTNMALGCTLMGSYPFTPIDTFLALAVHTLGIGLWFWGRFQISPISSRRLPNQPPLRLRRDGAFGIVRHPLYCGMLIAAAAPLAGTRNPMLGLTYAASVIAIVWRMLQEEARLREQVGADYDDYSREVRRLIPFIW